MSLTNPKETLSKVIADITVNTMEGITLDMMRTEL